MKFKYAGIAVLTLATSVCVPNSLVAQGPPPYGFHVQGGWDTPPSEYQEIGRRGYHDGIEGARKDFENHRKPNVKNRDEYRHPPVSSAERDEYRASFRRGYDTGVEHLMHDGGHH
jgi:ribosome modulation factor